MYVHTHTHTHTHIHTGLPLTFDIEGPSHNTSETVFVLGARPIANNQYDLNFGGRMASAVFLPSVAPPLFSTCVLDCAESLTVDTTSTAVTSTAFDVTTRTLVLFGPASPPDVQTVLRRAVYLNRAPSINVDAIRLEVFDGYNTTTAEVEVTQGMMRRRRQAVTRKQTPLRHLLSFPEVDNQRILEEEPSGETAPSNWLGLHWPAAVITLVVLSIVVTMAVWAIRRWGQQQPTLP